jgi:hypothetical protein
MKKVKNPLVALRQSIPTDLGIEPSSTMAPTRGWEAWTAARRPAWVCDSNLTFKAASTHRERAMITGATSMSSTAGATSISSTASCKISNAFS